MRHLSVTQGPWRHLTGRRYTFVRFGMFVVVCGILTLRHGGLIAGLDYTVGMVMLI